MVPYSSFMTLEKKQGLNEINRYNLYPSAPIQLSPAPGYSSGQAIQAIKEVAAETLPRGYGLGWEALAYDEASKGNVAIYIFLIVVVFVYLVLVGQYESFILPLAVIMSLPVGIFGSFLFLQAMGLANDVYCPDWSGHAGRSAWARTRFSIVEFAVQRHHEGVSLKEAAIEGEENSLPADSDDLLRLHRRSDSVGPCHRPRGDRKPHDRHHRGRRDAPGHRRSGSWSFPACTTCSAKLDRRAPTSSRTSRHNLLARGSNTDTNTDSNTKPVTKMASKTAMKTKDKLQAIAITIACSMPLALPSRGISELRLAGPRPDLPVGFI